MGRRLAVLVVALIGWIVTVPSAHAANEPNAVVGLPHFMRRLGGPAQNNPSVPRPSQAGDLLFHGGTVEHHPVVYLVFWGTEWKHGFTTGGGGDPVYTSAQAERYLEAFFKAVGGTSWNAIQTEYCDGINVGAVSCAGQPASTRITNTRNVLRGVWVDATPVPSEIPTANLLVPIARDPIASEAARAAQHFGFNVDATYFILTPPGHGATGYGNYYCAYHSEVGVVGQRGVRYAFVPFVQEYGSGCGQYSVNRTADAFGHGFFDSYSIVAGHEYAEAVTDPDAWPYQDGWNDVATDETGDKCQGALANLTVGHQYFAVQGLWSNRSDGGNGRCVFEEPG